MQLRARVGSRFTKFYNLGIWAEDSSTVQRHSVRAQGTAYLIHPAGHPVLAG